jgi:acyl-CoA thioester hydrolase
MHRYVVRVRYGDTDQMGFAYYAHYLRWFEIGRAEMLRALGSSYRAIEESGVLLPVTEARCRYLSPARYDDEVRIETGVRELKRASVRFAYHVRRESDGALLAEGETEHCFLDRAGKPARPHAGLAELLQRAPRETPLGSDARLRPPAPVEDPSAPPRAG